MPRNFTVRTTTGHTVRFKKDEVVLVPDNLKVVEECQKYGAMYASPQDAPDLPDDTPLPTTLPKSPLERRARIKVVLREIYNNQEQFRSHFTAAGRPHLKFVQGRVGFDISASEVEELWNILVFKQTDEML
jgi:hypothetical protein